MNIHKLSFIKRWYGLLSEPIILKSLEDAVCLQFIVCSLTAVVDCLLYFKGLLVSLDNPKCSLYLTRKCRLVNISNLAVATRKFIE